MIGSRRRHLLVLLLAPALVLQAVSSLASGRCLSLSACRTSVQLQHRVMRGAEGHVPQAAHLMEFYNRKGCTEKPLREYCMHVCLHV